MENPFKKLFGKESKAKTKKEHKSDKELATEKELPYVNVIGFDLDKGNPSQGAFELDWNIYFINQLRGEGYQGKTDEDVVDNWFQKVCKNVALETWENYDADPENRSTVNEVKRDDGKTEIS